MSTTQHIDEALIARVVAQVLRALLGGGLSGGLAQLSALHGAEEVARRDLPRYITDVQARRDLYGGCDRVSYWRLTKDPKFPPAVLGVGRSKLRKTADHLAYLAARAEPAPEPEPAQAPVRRRRRAAA